MPCTTHTDIEFVFETFTHVEYFSPLHQVDVKSKLCNVEMLKLPNSKLDIIGPTKKETYN